MRLTALAAAATWSGMVLLLSTTRWCSRLSTTDRLRTYAPARAGRAARDGVLSFESFRAVIGPLAVAVGARTSRLLGVTEELGARLFRVHADLDVTAVRVRQLGWSVTTIAMATATLSIVSPPGPIVVLTLVGAPTLTFLALEQQTIRRSAQWQRRVFLELPVVAEQIGLLLSAGFSLSGALARVAERSDGACGRDLRRVVARTRSGLDETAALREWAAIARVDAVDRLVRVLALNREASDLGRLISEEARSIRRDVQRELVEQIEARAQQVWIPVTVATLIPGVIFIAVPFVQALTLFAAR